MAGVLVDDHPVPLDCKPCKGTGTCGDEWCMECGGVGCDWFDRAPLFMLAANLAVAAGLARAFRLGDARGLQAAWNRGLHGCTVDPHNMWCQNIEGRAAPLPTTPVAARAGEES